MQQYYGDTVHFISKTRPKATKKRYPLSRLLFFIVTLSLAVVVALSFVPQSHQLSPRLTTVRSRSYYFVRFYVQDEYAQAEMDAQEIINGGGGGYIVNDGRYHVTAAVFGNKSDAQAVASKQSDADVYEYKIAAFQLDSAVYDDYAHFFSLYASVFDEISLMLDRYDGDTVTDAALWLCVEENCAKFTDAANKITDGDYLSATLKQYLIDSGAALTLVKGEEKVENTSRVRHGMCQIVTLRGALAAAINKNQ